MEKTLQHRVQSFQNQLQLLTVTPGFVQANNAAAKNFYEKWRKLNAECICSGVGNVADNCSFVDTQLRLLLDNWSTSKETIDIRDVFPMLLESAYLFGAYLADLDYVALS
jgi:hypothetical protein